jgi:hypothetical protein
MTIVVSFISNFKPQLMHGISRFLVMVISVGVGLGVEVGLGIEVGVSVAAGKPGIERVFWPLIVMVVEAEIKTAVPTIPTMIAVVMADMIISTFVLGFPGFLVMMYNNAPTTTAAMVTRVPIEVIASLMLIDVPPLKGITWREVISTS